MLVVILGVGGLLLVAVILFVFRDRGSSPTTVDKVGSTNIPVRNSEAGALIRDYLGIALGGGDVTGVSEEVMIESMRHKLSAVVEELGYVYDSIARDAYNARWAIVYCATKLESPEILVFLNGIVKSSIPPEESRNIHLYSTVAEETTIRMRALEGVRLLAVNANNDAKKALFSFLRLPSLSLRIAACQALINLPGGESDRIRIREELPTSERAFLDLRHARAENFWVDNAPFGVLVPRPRRTPINSPPPLAQDAQEGEQTAIPARPARKGPPVIS